MIMEYSSCKTCYRSIHTVFGNINTYLAVYEPVDYVTCVSTINRGGGAYG